MHLHKNEDMGPEEEIKQRDNQKENPLRKLSLVMFKLLDSFKRARGVLFALGVAIVSTVLNILSYLAGETIHSLYVILWISTTVITLSIIALIITRPALPQSVNTVGYLVLTSLLTGCGSMSLLLGIMISGPADVVSLLFTMPVILVILEAIIKKKKPKILHLLFTVCSIVGVVFVTRPSFLFNRNSSVNIWGIMLGLLSAFLHAGGMISMRELAESHLHPFILCIGPSITIWTISFLSSFFIEGVAFPSEVRVFLELLGSGVSHFGSYTFGYLALATERPFVVSSIMTSEVAFTFVAQWLALNITPTWYSAIGGFLITVACIGVTLTKDVTLTNDDYHNNAGEEEHLLHE